MLFLTALRIRQDSKVGGQAVIFLSDPATSFYPTRRVARPAVPAVASNDSPESSASLTDVAANKDDKAADNTRLTLIAISISSSDMSRSSIAPPSCPSLQLTARLLGRGLRKLSMAALRPGAHFEPKKHLRGPYSIKIFSKNTCAFKINYLLAIDFKTLYFTRTFQ